MPEVGLFLVANRQTKIFLIDSKRALEVDFALLDMPVSSNEDLFTKLSVENSQWSDLSKTDYSYNCVQF